MKASQVAYLLPSVAAFLPSPIQIHSSSRQQLPLYASVASTQPQTIVEQRQNSTVGLYVTVPGPLTKKAYDSACSRLANDRKVAIPGFRKGQKIPEQVLLNSLGGPAAIINEALDVLCEDTLKKAIDETDIKAVGQAKLAVSPEELIKSYQPGKDLQVELVVDVYPTVKFTGDYRKLKITAEQIPLEDDKVKAAMDALRKKRVKLADTDPDYIAKMGDSAVVNMRPYQMLSDGTRGPELNNVAAGEGVEVILEEGRFLPGVVESIVGVKAGDRRTVPITFPKQIRDPKLAGLKVEFDIEVLSVKNRVIPEVTDEFADQIRPGLTAAEMEKEVVSAVNADAEERTKANRNKALEDALLEIVETEVPECWILEESRRKFAMMMQEISGQGKSEEEVKRMITKENFEKYRDISMPSTLRTLKLGVATAMIAEQENLRVNEVDLQDQVDLRKMEAEKQGMTEKALQDQIEAKMLADLVMDLLAQEAEITYVKPKEA